MLLSVYVFYSFFFLRGENIGGFSNEQYTCACTQNPKGMLLTHTLWVRQQLDPAVSILVCFIIYFILSWLLISKIVDCYCPMFQERQGTPHPLVGSECGLLKECGVCLCARIAQWQSKRLKISVSFVQFRLLAILEFFQFCFTYNPQQYTRVGTLTAVILPKGQGSWSVWFNCLHRLGVRTQLFHS